MMTLKPMVRARLAVIAMAIFLTSCSAMLIGEGGSGSAGIGTSTRSSAQSSADGTLAGAVKSAMSSEPMLRSETVSVSARNGVVTLAGTVGSFDARDRAVQIASGLVGVVRVANQLQVKTR